MRRLDQIPISYPIPVMMRGFRSDTATLQRAGWEISADQSMSSYGYGRIIQLAMRNTEMGVQALTNRITLDSRVPAFVQSADYGGLMQYLQSITFEVVAFHQVIEFQTHIVQLSAFDNQELNLRPGGINFLPIDARPQMMATTERFSLSDLCLFKKVNDAPEFLIEKASVDDLLKIITEKQAPIQKQIRERQRRAEFKKELEGFDSPREIRAQLISVG